MLDPTDRASQPIHEVIVRHLLARAPHLPKMVQDGVEVLLQVGVRAEQFFGGGRTVQQRRHHVDGPVRKVHLLLGARYL